MQNEQTPAAGPHEADDPPCTDCDDTGITHQTERACSCSAGDAYRPHVASPASSSSVVQGEASGVEREPITHEVKCWSEPFAAVKSGAKPWELRINDRDYRTGDTLIQREWSPDAKGYTGEQTAHRIGWMLHGPAFGLPAGYVIMTLEALRPQPSGEMREAVAREILAQEYERRGVGEGPYPTHAALARTGHGSFTMCSIRAVEAALIRPAPVASSDQPEQGASEGESVALMRPFWVSWWGEPGTFELHRPWWVSGERDDGKQSIVAAVLAQDEFTARLSVQWAHDDKDAVIEWRFSEEKPKGWAPFGSRFHRADWMIWPESATPAEPAEARVRELEAEKARLGRALMVMQEAVPAGYHPNGAGLRLYICDLKAKLAKAKEALERISKMDGWTERDGGSSLSDATAAAAEALAALQEAGEVG